MGKIEILGGYLEAMEIPSTSVATELEKIAHLRARRLLTPAEFEAAKKNLLDAKGPSMWGIRPCPIFAC